MAISAGPRFKITPIMLKREEDYYEDLKRAGEGK